jgi:cold shock CspA family protein
MAEGEVLAFDEPAGYGTIESSTGERYFFHCTAIADGSRTIAVGVPVVFDVVPGRRGRWEAAAVGPA